MTSHGILMVVPAREIYFADALEPGPAAAVSAIDAAVIETCQDLVDTLKASTDALALSAPQIGQNLRIIVVDLKGRPGAKLADGPLIIVNPEIVASDGLHDAEETCTSLPGTKALVSRPHRIFLRGLTIQGAQVGAETSGLEARLIQHAIDHLDGRLIVSGH